MLSHAFDAGLWCTVFFFEAAVLFCIPGSSKQISRQGLVNLARVGKGKGVREGHRGISAGPPHRVIVAFRLRQNGRTGCDMSCVVVFVAFSFSSRQVSFGVKPLELRDVFIYLVSSHAV